MHNGGGITPWVRQTHKKSTPSPNRLTTCFVGHTNPTDPKLSFQLRFDCGEMGRLQPAATGPKWLRNCCCCCCCCRCCSCRCRCCCCFRDAIAVRDEIAALEIHQTFVKAGTSPLNNACAIGSSILYFPTGPPCHVLSPHIFATRPECPPP